MYAILKLDEVPESCIDCPCDYDSILCQALGSPDGVYSDAEQHGRGDAWETRLSNCPLQIIGESE